MLGEWKRNLYYLQIWISPCGQDHPLTLVVLDVNTVSQFPLPESHTSCSTWSWGCSEVRSLWICVHISFLHLLCPSGSHLFHLIFLHLVVSQKQLWVQAALKCLPSICFAQSKSAIGSDCPKNLLSFAFSVVMCVLCINENCSNESKINERLLIICDHRGVVKFSCRQSGCGSFPLHEYHPKPVYNFFFSCFRGIYRWPSFLFSPQVNLGLGDYCDRIGKADVW